MEAEKTTVTDLLDKYKGDEAKLNEFARMAESSERFEEMCLFMKALIDLKIGGEEEKKKPLSEQVGLSLGERNMLSVAYKNVVGVRRAAWRSLTSQSGAEISEDLQNSYKAIIETELQGKCDEVLQLIEKKLLPIPDTVKALEKNTLADDNAKQEQKESVIFYLKMCGDYYRYLAEFKESDQKVKDNAAAKYKSAMDIAQHCLAPTHPTRLGLVLNASVCHYEILKNPEKARKLAKEGFDQAIQKLDSLSDSTYKDSTLIMQLLRDNLTIWASNDPSNSEQQED